MKHKGQGNTNWNSPGEPKEGTEGIGNQRENWDHADNNVAEIG